MTQEEVFALLQSTGLAVTYYQWPEGAAPPLPWVAYLDTGSDNFSADGTVYYQATTWRAELYTLKKDPGAERRLENVLTSAGLFWRKLPTAWIDSERMFEIPYEFEV